jgi:hypothetical protein
MLAGSADLDLGDPGRALDRQAHPRSTAPAYAGPEPGPGTPTSPARDETRPPRTTSRPQETTHHRASPHHRRSITAIDRLNTPDGVSPNTPDQATRPRPVPTIEHAHRHTRQAPEHRLNQPADIPGHTNPQRQPDGTGRDGMWAESDPVQKLP